MQVCWLYTAKIAQVSIEKKICVTSKKRKPIHQALSPTSVEYARIDKISITRLGLHHCTDRALYSSKNSLRPTFRHKSVCRHGLPVSPVHSQKCSQRAGRETWAILMHEDAEYSKRETHSLLNEHSHFQNAGRRVRKSLRSPQ